MAPTFHEFGITTGTLEAYILARIDQLPLSTPHDVDLLLDNVAIRPSQLTNFNLQHALLNLFCERWVTNRTIFTLLPCAPGLDPSNTIFRAIVSHSEIHNIQPKHYIFGRDLDPPRPTGTTDPLTAIWKTASTSQSLVLADSSGASPIRELGVQAVSKYDATLRYKWWIPDTYALSLPVDRFLDATSYHAELICPPGVYFDHSFLRVANGRGQIALSITGSQSEATEMILIIDDDHHPDRSHLYFSEDLSAEGIASSKKMEGSYAGILNTILRPTFHNGLRTGMWVALWSTIALGVISILSGIQAAGQSLGSVCIVPITGQPSCSTGQRTVVSLLLVALSLALGSIAHQDEHFLTKRVQGAYRTRLTIVGVLLFTVAFAAAIGLGSWNFFGLDTGCFLLASFVTSVITVSALYSKQRTLTRDFERLA
jgi:hypothetical protein